MLYQLWKSSAKSTTFLPVEHFLGTAALNPCPEERCCNICMRSSVCVETKTETLSWTYETPVSSPYTKTESCFTHLPWVAVWFHAWPIYSGHDLCFTPATREVSKAATATLRRIRWWNTNIWSGQQTLTFQNTAEVRLPPPPPRLQDII